MKKEDKYIRAAVSADLFDAIKKDPAGDTPADVLKAILYPHYGIRQPKPPTPEQRRILSSLSNMRSMVKQGFLDQAAYEEAKQKAYRDYDIGVDDDDDEQDDEQDEARSDTEGIENTESTESKASTVEKKAPAPAKRTPTKK